MDPGRRLTQGGHAAWSVELTMPLRPNLMDDLMAIVEPREPTRFPASRPPPSPALSARPSAIGTFVSHHARRQACGRSDNLDAATGAGDGPRTDRASASGWPPGQPWQADAARRGRESPRVAAGTP